MSLLSHTVVPPFPLQEKDPCCLVGYLKIRWIVFLQLGAWTGVSLFWFSRLSVLCALQGAMDKYIQRIKKDVGKAGAEDYIDKLLVTKKRPPRPRLEWLPSKKKAIAEQLKGSSYARLKVWPLSPTHPAHSHRCRPPWRMPVPCPGGGQAHPMRSESLDAR